MWSQDPWGFYCELKQEYGEGKLAEGKNELFLDYLKGWDEGGWLFYSWKLEMHTEKLDDESAIEIQ